MVRDGVSVANLDDRAIGEPDALRAAAGRFDPEETNRPSLAQALPGYAAIIDRGYAWRLWRAEVASLLSLMFGSIAIGLLLLVGQVSNGLEPFGLLVLGALFGATVVAAAILRHVPGLTKNSSRPLVLDTSGLTVFPRHFFPLPRIAKLTVFQNHAVFIIEVRDSSPEPNRTSSIVLGARWIADPDLFLATAESLFPVERSPGPPPFGRGKLIERLALHRE